MDSILLPLISMGCTTALQASVANVPVIEVEDPDLELDKGQNRGFLIYLLIYHTYISGT